LIFYNIDIHAIKEIKLLTFYYTGTNYRHKDSIYKFFSYDDSDEGTISIERDKDIIYFSYNIKYSDRSNYFSEEPSKEDVFNLLIYINI